VTASPRRRTVICPRSSADRASASGAVCAGSSPAGGTKKFGSEKARGAHKTAPKPPRTGAPRHGGPPASETTERARGQRRRDPTRTGKGGAEGRGREGREGLGGKGKEARGELLSDLRRRVEGRGTSAWVHGRERSLLADDSRPGPGETGHDGVLPRNAHLAGSVSGPIWQVVAEDRELRRTRRRVDRCAPDQRR
jgi:hypothetical protein